MMDDSTLEKLLGYLERDSDRQEKRIDRLEKKFDALIEKTARLWERSGIYGLIAGSIPAAAIIAWILIKGQ